MILSTNIAEASVTIDGIKFVIDCGFVKLRTFNPRTGMDVLSVTPCSVASANQRTGRAGRTAPGKCFRLYTSDMVKNGQMPITTPPEVSRTDVSLFVLQLKALGIDNVLRFDFMTPPPSQMLVRAMEFLYSLKALDEDGRLTKPLGTSMAELPVDPMMAAIVSVVCLLTSSHIPGCPLTLLSFNVFVHTMCRASASQFCRISMWRRDLDYCCHDVGAKRLPY